MPSYLFPPTIQAEADTGLLAIGGDLGVSTLLEAYAQGIFPWPHTDQYISWFAPASRAVLNFSDFHRSRSLTRKIRQNQFEYRRNHDFPSVIANCAHVSRRGQSDTWITDQMIEAYSELHKAGYAESFEVYSPDAGLVGGVYGVGIGSYFAAESMFHLATDASKLALNYLISELQAEGMTWIDVQVQNDFLKSLGVCEISRAEFEQRLVACRQCKL